MNLAFTKTRSALGILAKSVSVEVHLANGLPAFTIVGLAETAVRESRDRVQSAIINSHFEFPCRKIIVNLAPADLPKSGSGFDLPIAIGILAASGQIPLQSLEDHEFIGELALGGNLRGITAILPAVLAARLEKKKLIIATANAEEAALADYEGILSAQTLKDVCAYLCQGTPLTPLPPLPLLENSKESMDWSDVKGQFHAKQALEIAALGGHSVLLSGAPGAGKTLLAQRFATLLPDLSENHALECAAIHSIRGKIPLQAHWKKPPFRSPHHTASPVALAGGGNPPKPGEISLAHHGVLFLDELPEFSKQVLETLRQPLEAGTICISRASMQTEFPAKFQLLAAMNPCPCGHWGNPKGDCICSPDRISRYLGKLSGPLLERIDMQVMIYPLNREELLQPHSGERNLSSQIREKVIKIRELQIKRQGCLNAHLSPRQSEELCELTEESQHFINLVMDKLSLSARSYHRLLKVARTIADNKGSRNVDIAHLQLAFSFKQTMKKPI